MLAKLTKLSATIGGGLQSILLLAVRLYWGWQFFITGKGKLGNLSRVTGFFAGLHIPFPHVNAVVVGVTECFGGLLLMLGLGTRLVAPIFVFEMLVAFATADRDAARSLFSDYDKFVKSDTFPFFFAALIVFVFGPGKVALDSWMSKGKKD
jgi:putative oxidoreductase